MDKRKLIPTSRELVSVVEFVCAAICFLNQMKWVALNDLFPQDARLFQTWPKVGSAAIMCLLFGMSAWIPQPTNNITRLCTRIFVIIYLITASLDIMVSAKGLKAPYEEKYVFGKAESQCWDDEYFAEMDAAIAGAIIVAWVMIGAAVALIILEVKGVLYLLWKMRQAQVNRNQA